MCRPDRRPSMQTDALSRTVHPGTRPFTLSALQDGSETGKDSCRRRHRPQNGREYPGSPATVRRPSKPALPAEHRARGWMKGP